jgi:hypothetical protein
MVDNMSADKLTLTVLDETGDTPFEYDPADAGDIQRAENYFNEMLGKGFSAFYVDPFDSKDEPMSAFDPKAGRIIFVPPVKAGYPSPPGQPVI